MPFVQQHRKSRKYDAYKGKMLKQAEYIALLLFILFLILRFLIGISWVCGESMSPTLGDGAAVVYFRPTKDFKIGDIISIKMAYGEYYIKRVVAVGGDVVDIRDGVLYVNGEPETGQWAIGDTELQSGSVIYPCTVPAGSCFAVGDNRAASIDSRTFGPIAASQVRGVILFHLG